MDRTDESVVFWNKNVTLRQFMIVSCLLMTWIGVDLAIDFLSHNGIEGFYFLKNVDSVTGLKISKTISHWLPANSWRLHIYTAYSLPAIGFISWILLDRLVHQGNTCLPWGIAVCGGAFIAGGAILDIAVTVMHSPDLDLEGNPYIRVLLDSRHPLPFVYTHAMITQIVYIALFCCVWIGFLRHREIIINTISASAPTTWLEFVKAATGGAHLTVRQWLFPIRLSEIPLLYHYLWLTAIPVVFGISLFRWYTAMEWLGIVEREDHFTRVLIVVHGVLSTLVLYFLVLWRMYQQTLQTVSERRG